MYGLYNESLLQAKQQRECGAHHIYICSFSMYPNRHTNQEYNKVIHLKEAMISQCYIDATLKKKEKEIVGAVDTDMDLCKAIHGVLDRSSVPNDDSGEADLTH